MEKAKIIVGEGYAVRKAPGRAGPLEHVRVLEPGPGQKWKVKWITPNSGRVGLVASRQVVVLWRDREAFLADEESEAKLVSDNERHGYDEESALAAALYLVFDTFGGGVSFIAES